MLRPVAGAELSELSDFVLWVLERHTVHHFPLRFSGQSLDMCQKIPQLKQSPLAPRLLLLAPPLNLPGDLEGTLVNGKTEKTGILSAKLKHCMS